jgi:transforming growth factor-beta-induced protein
MKKLAFAIPLLALVLAACSTDEASLPSILDRVRFSDDTATLAVAVETSGDAIPAALDADGALTLFAPTEAGFAQALADAAAVCGVAEYTAADLLGVDPAVLQLVLQYHVVPAEAFAADLSDGQVLTMLAGGEVTVQIAGGTVTLVDAVGRSATVVAADRNASNGVVHLIDNVLLPTADPAVLNCPAA